MDYLIHLIVYHKTKRAFNRLFTSVCDGIMCAVRPIGRFTKHHWHKALIAIESMAFFSRFF